MTNARKRLVPGRLRVYERISWKMGASLTVQRQAPSHYGLPFAQGLRAPLLVVVVFILDERIGDRQVVGIVHHEAGGALGGGCRLL
jgi:hypothetical protein